MSDEATTPLTGDDGSGESSFSLDSLKDMIMENKEIVVMILAALLAYYLYTQNCIQLPSTSKDD